ncbi:protein kinase rad3 [Stemphylium lycopersici]|uniref:Serine/threonine-protein kinase MEC1 n=1 Tax=Stemphylium lycopersici TaxID=183478 RepID=A0A364N3G2_STELY|nr:protein kinase rad3 [Stemphylium lycopersici]RAR05324.1 protein kinase rad3 [Stemphylium lycopersici]RAR10804.1 protein kinase rad3 [Stemphylium lycopersici]
MARKGGGSTQRMAPPPLTNGHSNAIPPSSTIAAQIVHNASNVHARQDEATKVTFGELVKEFLQHPNTNEPDPQLVALICVIAEAGLEGLFKDDPFAQDQQRQQGIDSIAALTFILQQKPHLLLSAKQGDDESIPCPPLILWLYPKLLGLLTHATLQPLHEHVQQLLNLCINVLGRTSALLRPATTVLQLYRSCVNCILSELDSLDDPTSLPISSFNLPLPPSSAINEFWPESQHFVALPHDLQRPITSHHGAIHVGFCLLLAVVNTVQPKEKASATPIALAHYVPWIVDNVRALWRYFTRWTISSTKRPIYDEITMAYVQLLESSFIPSIISADQSPISLKTAQALTSSLAELIDSLAVTPVAEVIQIQIASIFARLRSFLSSEHADALIPRRRQDLSKSVVQAGLQDSVNRCCQDAGHFTKLDKDLQLALCLWTSPGSWPMHIADLRKELCENESGSFSDAQISEESASTVKTFRTLNLDVEDRPAKRRKTLPDSSDDTNKTMYERLAITLNGSTQDSPVLNLSNLHNIVQARYSSMPDDEQQNERVQEDLMIALSKIACAGSRALEPPKPMSQALDFPNCTLCDINTQQERGETVYWNIQDGGENWKDAIAAMLAITKEPAFQESSQPRVLMAVAIGRVYNHISDPEYLALENCELGQWLLACMSRSLRELKLAAISSLMVFLREDISRGTREKNRRSTIEFLDALAKRDVLSDQETLIMAYGRIAQTCGELELPIILHHLVEYLGHPNALVCGMAYREIEAIAKGFSMDTTQLLGPYWKVIGFSAIKDIINKPQKAQQLADLTEQSVRQLLVQTQADTLPHLVLSKRRDIIEKIAQARKASVIDVLTHPRANLAKILALLLSQPVPDVESTAMETLAAIEPAIRDGNNNRLESWVALDITGIAIEILMLAADQEGVRKKPFYNGFTTLAMLAPDTKSGPRKSTSKSKNLDAFCETHILGIIAYFSNVIETPNSAGKAVPHTRPERKRCIAAIGDLISLARYSVNGALPQIRACLQSAMADPDLCDDTFSVWSAFLSALDAEETMLVVDQTFALIVQHWPLFSEDTQLKAHKAIANIIAQHNAQLRARIEFLPSLAGIPMLSKIEGELVKFKDMVETIKVFHAFSNRCKDQNSVVVRQALRELVPFLDANQEELHQSVVGQKPLPVLATLTRSLLDASVRFSEDHSDITILCAQCLGIVGGLDPYRVETVREKKRVLMLSNFSRRDEDIDFVALLLEQVLVKVFLSTTNAKAQGWIAYVMQEMLKHCGFSALRGTKPRSSQNSTEAQRWNNIPEAVRTVLTPFLDSKYSVNMNPALQYEGASYPIFYSKLSHATWLQTFVYDLLRKGQGVNVEMVFPVLARIIRGYDLSIATFILPFAALNVIVSDNDKNMMNVGQELLRNVFQTLDYLSLWLQEKRKSLSDARVMAGKTGRGVHEDEEMNAIKQVSRVEGILQLIPAEIISRRAVECGSYARALFHWEQYYRQQRDTKAESDLPFSEKDELLQHLQMIYAHIDEPDSIEGISAHLKVLNPEQQIIEDRKAGRWTAAQSWYEIALAERPNDVETQINLLTCLKESGQYDSILNYVDGFHATNSLSSSTLPFAAEAAWSSGKWDQLKRILSVSNSVEPNTFMDFNVGVGQALLALRGNQSTEFQRIIAQLRELIARSLTPSTTTSVQASHDHLVKLHALYEIEAVSGMGTGATMGREVVLENLDRRLDIIGAYTSDKQYLLGLRRAAMTLSRIEFTKLDIASAWLTTGRLARKGDFMTTAFNSVLHAERLGDNASKIEYSKLLWKEGHHRKAIQNLRGAIDSNAFQQDDTVPINVSVTTSGRGDEHSMNKVKCHAQLLLAKWLDRAGQTQAVSLKEEYVTGVQTYPRWDKGHYYLGRWYLKLLESEKQQSITKQSPEYLSGSLIKLVIENFVRSTVYGTKYYYQTLPKILTLWLDMGMEVMNNHPRSAKDKEFHEHRLNYLDHINKYLKRYAGERMPAFAWYTAFPQIITRISHPNKNVWDALQTIIIRVASSYPQQSLWALLAVLHSTQDDRRARGAAVLQKLRVSSQTGQGRKSANKKKDASRRKGAALDLKSLIIQGQRLTDALLAACDAPIEARVARVSLARDLGFNHKLAPTPLVVPIEANLLPNLPAGNDSQTIRRHNPFPADAITIQFFDDDVLVLSSLQRPRKLNVRGSDGRSYGLLCKPKDDLRKDQRLMEFNAMINRALQRDIESSKRRLYIKTYAVTPLNEECGAIEWVEGLKPMRDIILRFYRQRNIMIDYTEIRMLLNEASSSPSKVPIFTKRILGKFMPVLHEWFVETFPEPEAWFAARLRYTRSCAVMSIVGHVLGLGDRHGENVLLEQGDGGTFHVDFNCLFDKGLTFEKPELVPFRLTHNMVDAMGPQGVEGPFRKAAELTYKLLRQHEDTLITILETFVHDPTADFLGGKRRKKIAGVPDTPQEVLDITRTKVNGYLKGESVPLSVEGYVEALIAMARDPQNLAAMYIGWCAFF